MINYIVHGEQVSQWADRQQAMYHAKAHSCLYARKVIVERVEGRYNPRTHGPIILEERDTIATFLKGEQL